MHGPYSHSVQLFESRYIAFYLCLQIQGAIMVAALFQSLIGFSGLVGLQLRFIRPLTIAPTVTLVGLSLFQAAGNFSGTTPGLFTKCHFISKLLSSNQIKLIKIVRPSNKK